MNEILLFGKALYSENSSLDWDTKQEILKKGLIKGYMIDPCCDLKRVDSFLNTLPNNYNCTFYESFQFVKDTTDVVLFLHQMLHYASTYGTNFVGKAYIPNSEPVDINLTDGKILSNITLEGIAKKINTMLSSGIAVKSDDITKMFALISELYNPGLISSYFDHNEWNNREAITRWYINNNIPAKNADMFMQMLNYAIVGNCMVIKSRETISQYSCDLSGDIADIMANADNRMLAEKFNRYKPLFLALKKRRSVDSAQINKISKLSKTLHKPVVVPLINKFLTKDYLLSSEDPEGSAEKVIANLSIFQLEKLLRAVRSRYSKCRHESSIDSYKIRNGKTFLKESKSWFDSIDVESVNGVQQYHEACDNMHGVLLRIELLLRNKLVNKIASKLGRKKVKLPVVDIAIPTSQKDFVGPFPYGSVVKFSDADNFQVGIHWKGSDGATDLDLSLRLEDGRMVAWNTGMKLAGVTHSGDMTTAEPEAAEIISCEKGIPAGTVKISPYCCKSGAKFRFFIAKDGEVPENAVDYTACIDPNAIIFDTMLEIDGELTLGVFSENSFMFTARESSKLRVASLGNYNDLQIKAEKANLDRISYLRDFLSEEQIVSEGEEVNPENMIDLSTNDKSTLIELLS